MCSSDLPLIGAFLDHLESERGNGVRTRNARLAAVHALFRFAALRHLGIRALPGRRATLLQLAAEVPAAILADLLHLSPGTATRWTRDAGGNWSRYAASLALTRSHQG